MNEIIGKSRNEKASGKDGINMKRKTLIKKPSLPINQ